MKKTLILLLCAAMLMGTLAGCGGETASEPTATPTEAPTATPETPLPQESDLPEEEVPAIDSEAILTAAAAAHDPGEVILTVSGEPVTWGEFFYWMYSSVSQLEYYNSYYTGSSVFGAWDDACLFDPTVTNAQYVLNYAIEATTWYHSVEQGALRAGAKLSEEDEQYLADLYQSDVDSYGGGDEAAFLEYIEGVHLPKEVYDYINRFYCNNSNGFELMYGVDGARLTDEEVLEYAEGGGYLAAKHILLLTTDDTGAALDETAKAEVYAKMEDFLAQLQAKEGDRDALIELFDQLMTENSEDTGLSYYPDGYCFPEGQMVEEFEAATRALEAYGISGIVESTHGYHIILRLPLDPGMLAEYSEDGLESHDLRYIVAAAMYSANQDSWVGEAELVWSEGYEDMDVVGLLSE